MKRTSCFLLAAVLLFSACQQSFKKGEQGLEYKIISGSKGEPIKYGEFMQMEIAQIYSNGKKDSILSDTRTSSGAIIQPLDSINTPKEYFNILKQLKNGDSLVIRILSDSIMQKNPMGLPPFMKKGHYLVTTVKMINVFKTREEAEAAFKEEQGKVEARMKEQSKEQEKKDIKTLEDYFAKNKIQVLKAPEGTFVEILTPGTGPNIDTSVVIKVKYTGKTMDGVIFDSNVDPSFPNHDPILVNMTNDPSLGQPVIKGWTDGFKMLNKGAIAKFYITSPMAYGANSPTPKIPANSILTFDVEVVDVLNKVQAKVEADAQMKKMNEIQKRFMDSMKQAHRDTTAKVK
ncbi:MAG: hypothetical protein ABS68_11710 [Niastella sp. SCN 39-18]|nr:FKBP-type peptidyl-prolyl cis-trans isomerase [Sphingobacteriales bacterium]ODT51815.1 MAG: hypothetical protein ABS68_11710 [Niastella sp. SCN 39-18]